RSATVVRDSGIICGSILSWQRSDMPPGSRSVLDSLATFGSFEKRFRRSQNQLSPLQVPMLVRDVESEYANIQILHTDMPRQSIRENDWCSTLAFLHLVL